jgi:hypothetical protein
LTPGEQEREHDYGNDDNYDDDDDDNKTPHYRSL